MAENQQQKEQYPQIGGYQFGKNFVEATNRWLNGPSGEAPLNLQTPSGLGPEYGTTAYWGENIRDMRNPTPQAAPQQATPPANPLMGDARWEPPAAPTGDTRWVGPPTPYQKTWPAAHQSALDDRYPPVPMAGNVGIGQFSIPVPQEAMDQFTGALGVQQANETIAPPGMMRVQRDAERARQDQIRGENALFRAFANEDPQIASQKILDQAIANGWVEAPQDVETYRGYQQKVMQELTRRNSMAQGLPAPTGDAGLDLYNRLVPADFRARSGSPDVGPVDNSQLVGIPAAFDPAAENQRLAVMRAATEDPNLSSQGALEGLRLQKQREKQLTDLMGAAKKGALGTDLSKLSESDVLKNQKARLDMYTTIMEFLGQGLVEGPAAENLAGLAAGLLDKGFGEQKKDETETS